MLDDLLIKRIDFKHDRPPPMYIKVLEWHVQKVLSLQHLKTGEVRHDAYPVHTDPCKIFLDIHHFIIRQPSAADGMLAHTGPPSFATPFIVTSSFDPGESNSSCI